MTDHSTNRPSSNENERNDTTHHQSPEADRSPVDPSQMVDVQDLVYKGGFDKDPQEILGNPAVAPEMLQEGRDLRVDLFKEAEDTVPTQEEESNRDNTP